MIVLALTGSIGMGKSTVLEMFRAEGCAVWNADAAVHRLYAEGGAAVEPVAALAPQALSAGAIDRDALAAAVLKDEAKLKALEAIVHPLVAQDRARFLEEARARQEEIAVLDIPLLFETGGDTAFDAVVVVSAPADIQRARVLARPGMTEEKFRAVLARQTPDAEKRARADFVIDTAASLQATRDRVRAVLGQIRAR